MLDPKTLSLLSPAEPKDDAATFTDGDSGYFGSDKKDGFRIKGMNTPESENNFDRVDKHPDGRLAAETIKMLQAEGAQVIRGNSKGEYGRGLSEFVDADGNDLTQDMVRSGLAFPDRSREAAEAASDRNEREFLGKPTTFNKTIREQAEKRQGGEKFTPWNEGEANDVAHDRRGTFHKAFDRGTDQTKSALGGVMNYIGDLIGNDEWVADGKRMTQKANLNSKLNPREVENFKEIKDVGTAFDYLLETTGELAPGLILDAVATIGTGGLALGAVATRRVGSAVLVGAAKLAAEKSMKKAVKVGMIAGPTATGFLQSLGGMENTLEERGSEVNTGAAALSGVVGGAVNVIPYALVAGDILKQSGLADDVVKKVVEGVEQAEKSGFLSKAGGRLKDITKTAGKAGAGELFTEVPQMYIDELIASSNTDGKWQLETTDAIDGALRAVFGGAAMGGTASIAANTVSIVNEYNQARSEAAADEAPENDIPTAPEAPQDGGGGSRLDRMNAEAAGKQQARKATDGEQAGDKYFKGDGGTKQSKDANPDIAIDPIRATSLYESINDPSAKTSLMTMHDVPELAPERSFEMRELLIEDGKPASLQTVSNLIATGEVTPAEVVQFAASSYGGVETAIHMDQSPEAEMERLDKAIETTALDIRANRMYSDAVRPGKLRILQEALAATDSKSKRNIFDSGSFDLKHMIETEKVQRFDWRRTYESFRGMRKKSIETGVGKASDSLSIATNKAQESGRFDLLTPEARTKVQAPIATNKIADWYAEQGVEGAAELQRLQEVAMPTDPKNELPDAEHKKALDVFEKALTKMRKKVDNAAVQSYSDEANVTRVQDTKKDIPQERSDRAKEQNSTFYNMPKYNEKKEATGTQLATLKQLAESGHKRASEIYATVSEVFKRRVNTAETTGMLKDLVAKTKPSKETALAYAEKVKSVQSEITKLEALAKSQLGSIEAFKYKNKVSRLTKEIKAADGEAKEDLQIKLNEVKYIENERGSGEIDALQKLEDKLVALKEDRELEIMAEQENIARYLPIVKQHRENQKTIEKIRKRTRRDEASVKADNVENSRLEGIIRHNGGEVDVANGVKLKDLERLAKDKPSLSNKEAVRDFKAKIKADKVTREAKVTEAKKELAAHNKQVKENHDAYTKEMKLANKQLTHSMGGQNKGADDREYQQAKRLLWAEYQKIYGEGEVSVEATQTVTELPKGEQRDELLESMGMHETFDPNDVDDRSEQQIAADYEKRTGRNRSLVSDIKRILKEFSSNKPKKNKVEGKNTQYYAGAFERDTDLSEESLDNFLAYLNKPTDNEEGLPLRQGDHSKAFYTYTSDSGANASERSTSQKTPERNITRSTLYILGEHLKYGDYANAAKFLSQRRMISTLPMQGEDSMMSRSERLDIIIRTGKPTQKKLKSEGVDNDSIVITTRKGAPILTNFSDIVRYVMESEMGIVFNDFVAHQNLPKEMEKGVYAALSMISDIKDDDGNYKYNVDLRKIPDATVIFRPQGDKGVGVTMAMVRATIARAQVYVHSMQQQGQDRKLDTERFDERRERPETGEDAPLDVIRNQLADSEIGETNDIASMSDVELIEFIDYESTYGSEIDYIDEGNVDSGKTNEGSEDMKEFSKDYEGSVAPDESMNFDFNPKTEEAPRTKPVPQEGDYQSPDTVKRGQELEPQTKEAYEKKVAGDKEVKVKQAESVLINAKKALNAFKSLIRVGTNKVVQAADARRQKKVDAAKAEIAIIEEYVVWRRENAKNHKSIEAEHTSRKERIREDIPKAESAVRRSELAQKILRQRIEKAEGKEQRATLEEELRGIEVSNAAKKKQIEGLEQEFRDMLNTVQEKFNVITKEIEDNIKAEDERLSKFKGKKSEDIALEMATRSDISRIADHAARMTRAIQDPLDILNKQAEHAEKRSMGEEERAHILKLRDAVVLAERGVKLAKASIAPEFNPKYDVDKTSNVYGPSRDSGDTVYTNPNAPEQEDAPTTEAGKKSKNKKQKKDKTDKLFSNTISDEEAKRVAAEQEVIDREEFEAQVAEETKDMTPAQIIVWMEERADREGQRANQAEREKAEATLGRRSSQQRPKARRSIFKFVQMTYTRLTSFHPDAGRAAAEYGKASHELPEQMIVLQSKAFKDAADLQKSYEDFTRGANTSHSKKYSNFLAEVHALVAKHDKGFTPPKDSRKSIHLHYDKISNDPVKFQKILEKAGIKNVGRVLEAVLDGKGYGEFGVNPRATRGKARPGVPNSKLAPAYDALKEAGFLDNDAPRFLTRYLYAAGSWAAWNKVHGKMIDSPNGKGLWVSSSRYFDYSEVLHPQDKKEFGKLMDGLLGNTRNDMHPYIRKFNSASLAFQASTILWFSGVASIPETAGVYSRARGGTSLSDMQDDLKQLFTGKGRAELLKIAEDFDIVSKEVIEHTLQMLHGMGDVSTGRVSQKIIATVFKYNGQEALTRITRTLAVKVGQRFMLRHAASNTPNSKRMLKELGIDAATVNKFLADGDLSSPEGKKYRDALHRFTSEAVTNPNRAQVPLIMNDPLFTIFTSLKKFFYGFYDNVTKGLFNDAKIRRTEGVRTMTPIILTAVMLLPMGMAAELLRDFIKYPMGRPDGHEKDFMDRVKGGVMASGIFGPWHMAESAYKQSQYGRDPWIAAAGPTVGFLNELLRGEARPSRAVPLPLVAQHPYLSREFDKWWESFRE